MSAIKANLHQIGSNATISKNIVLSTDTATGDLLINKGVHDGALTEIYRFPTGGGLRDTVSVKDFGAHSTAEPDYENFDSTVAIQLAVNAVGANGTVEFPDGTYKITTSVIVSADNVTLDLGTCVIDASDFTGWTSGISSAWNSGRNKAVFEFRGSQAATTTLASSVAVNSIALPVASAAGINIGDIIEIRSSSELWYTYGATPVFLRDINVVTGVSGNTLTVRYPMRFAFSVSPAVVTVEAVTPLANSAIKGGSINGAGFIKNMLNGFGPVAIFMEGFADATIKDTTITGFQNKAIALRFGVGYTIKSSTFRGHTDAYATPIVEDQNSGFYGIWCESDRHGFIKNTTGNRVRHLIDGQNSFDHVVADCVANTTHASSYTCHERCTDWEFRYNKADNADHYACQWRGFSAKFIGNTWAADEASDDQYCWTDIAGSASDMERTYHFEGNSFSAGIKNTMLISASNIRRLAIVNNPYIGNNATTVFSPIRITSNSITEFIVSGNYIKSASNRCIEFDAAALISGNMITITDNTLEGYKEVPVKVTSTADGVNIVMKDNTLLPGAGGAGTLSYNLRASGIYRLGPNYTQSGAVWDGFNGIKFGNYLDSDSNTLDWYEEGTSNTGLELTVGGASTGVTYESKALYWCRIGRMVFFTARIPLTSKGALTGIVAVTLGTGYNCLVSGKAAGVTAMNLTSGVGDTALSAQVGFNSDSIRIYKQAAGTIVQLTAADITDTTELLLFGQYYTS